jgi:hypothetical protein
LVRARISQIRTAAHLTQMHAPIRRLLTLAVALAAGCSAVGQTMLTDRLDNISNWYSASTTPGVTLNNGLLSIVDGKQVVTYFAPAGSTINLATDEELVATFKLRFDTVVNDAGSFRLGLFNSTGTVDNPLRATKHGDTAQFQAYQGYMVSWNPLPPVPPSNTSNGLGVRRRTSPTLSSDLMSTTSVYSSALSGSGSPSGRTFIAGTTYDATFSVGRTSTGVTITFTVSDQTLGTFTRTVSDTTTSKVTSFDTFGLFSLSGASDYTISNLEFSFNGAITTTNVPEPSTYAACAGAAVLGLAFWRRRRAAAQALAA